MPDNLIALRVGTAQWMTDDGFGDLMHFLGHVRPRAVDEVAFFTSFTHPPLPLDEMERRCARLVGITQGPGCRISCGNKCTGEPWAITRKFTPLTRDALATGYGPGWQHQPGELLSRKPSTT